MIPFKIIAIIISFFFLSILNETNAGIKCSARPKTEEGEEDAGGPRIVGMTRPTTTEATSSRQEASTSEIEEIRTIYTISEEDTNPSRDQNTTVYPNKLKNENQPAVMPLKKDPKNEDKKKTTDCGLSCLGGSKFDGGAGGGGSCVTTGGGCGGSGGGCGGSGGGCGGGG